MNIKDKLKKIQGSRVISLIKNKANDMANKLECIPFTLTDEKILQALDDSDFKKLRRKLARILSREGKAAMYAIPYQGRYLVDVMEITNYSSIGKMEQMVEGTNGSLINRDGVDYPVHSIIAFTNNKPSLRTYIEYLFIDDFGKEQSQREWIRDEPFIYPGEALPVEVFLNNEAGESDVMYAGVGSDLCRLDYFDQQQKSEWERTRTLPAFNTNFTDNDPKTETAAIDAGRGYMVEDSYNAKLGAGTQMIPASTGSVILQNQIIFLEDDIYKKLGLKRDSTSTGTNKHNLEMVMSEQFGLEQLLSQKDIREQNYNQFFTKLATVLAVDAPAAVTLNISPIEQAKLDLLASTVLEAQMKAQNVSSQVNSQSSEDEGDDN